MALRIVTGVPGSGKSFFAVHHLLTKYFKWDETLDEFKPASDLLIISNIEGFPYSVLLEDEIEKAGSLEQFFNYDYQKANYLQKKTVYLIDECQHMFPFTMRNIEVFLYFQKHRHLGHDIYLLTQDADLLAKALRALAEYHIEAVRRSYSFLGEFRYKYVDPTSKEAWMTKNLKRDRRVFAFYKSMEGFETEEITSAPRRQFLFASLIFGIGILGFSYLLTGGRMFGVNIQKAGAQSKPVKEASKNVVSNKKSESLPDRPSGSLTSSTTPVALPEVGVGRLQGIAGFGEKTIYLVDYDGKLFRLSADELTTLCRCHTEYLIPGGSVRISLEEINNPSRSYIFTEHSSPAGSEAGGGGRARARVKS